MIGQQKRIEEVLRRMDFRIVKDVMTKCGLTWKNDKGEEYVPTQRNMPKNRIVNLCLETTIKNMRKL